MDRNQLIKDFNEAFCRMQEGRRYSIAWLSYIDYGGLYFTDKYFEVNAKAEHVINSYSDELKYVIHILNQHGLLKYTSSVRVYRPNEKYYIAYDDIIVYSETNLSRPSAA
jgi:hypothetical protein